MFDYLQQFNNLPQNIRDQVSAPEVMAILNELEKKYQVDLAVLVMKVIIKTQPIKTLPAFFMEEFGLEPPRATSLTQEITDKVFKSVADYLGIININDPSSTETRQSFVDEEVKSVILSSGIVLPSSELETRFKTIIATYLRGVRSRVATRDALAKEVILGGLNLSQNEIDRVLSSADKLSAISGLKQGPSLSAPSALDKIIAADLAAIKNQEYDFKKALESGQVNRFDYKKALMTESVKSSTETVNPLKEKVQKIIAGPVKKLSVPVAPKMVVAPDKNISLEAPIEAKRLTPSASVNPSISDSAPGIKPSTTAVPSKNIVSGSPLPNTPIKTAISPVPPVPHVQAVAPVSRGSNSFWKSLFKRKHKENKTVLPLKDSSKDSQLTQQSKTHIVTVNNQSNLNTEKQFQSSLVNKPQREELKITEANKNKPLENSDNTDEQSKITKHQAASNKSAISLAPSAPPIHLVDTPKPPVVASARPANHLKDGGTKPILQDVKPVPRVMGPIEELQFLDLVNFRRLSKTPAEITAKIFNKIKLLEADGYDRMIAGVRAWRRSPINLLYLKMMKEAINKGQTVKDLATSHQAEKSNYLNLEEIEEIIALNSKLIF